MPIQIIRSDITKIECNAMANCIELRNFLQQITNEEVYAITDYGKGLYYTQTEE